jgi:hypothetical protein
MEIIQMLSLVGAGLQLFVYILMQTKKIIPESYLYQSFNTIGSMIMFTVSSILLSYGFMIMEGTWMLVSAYGWYQLYRSRHI